VRAASSASAASTSDFERTTTDGSSGSNISGLFQIDGDFGATSPCRLARASISVSGSGPSKSGSGKLREDDFAVATDSTIGAIGCDDSTLGAIDCDDDARTCGASIGASTACIGGGVLRFESVSTASACIGGGVLRFEPASTTGIGGGVLRREVDGAAIAPGAALVDAAAPIDAPELVVAAAPIDAPELIDAPALIDALAPDDPLGDADVSDGNFVDGVELAGFCENAVTDRPELGRGDAGFASLPVDAVVVDGDFSLFFDAAGDFASLPFDDPFDAAAESDFADAVFDGVASLPFDDALEPDFASLPFDDVEFDGVVAALDADFASLPFDDAFDAAPESDFADAVDGVASLPFDDAPDFALLVVAAFDGFPSLPFDAFDEAPESDFADAVFDGFASLPFDAVPVAPELDAALVDAAPLAADASGFGRAVPFTVAVALLPFGGGGAPFVGIGVASRRGGAVESTFTGIDAVRTGPVSTGISRSPAGSASTRVVSTASTASACLVSGICTVRVLDRRVGIGATGTCVVRNAALSRGRPVGTTGPSGIRTAAERCSPII
jgi:hypothetical protein